MWLWSLGRDWLLVSSLVAQSFPRQRVAGLSPKQGNDFWTFGKWYQLPRALTSLCQDLTTPRVMGCPGPCLLFASQKAQLLRKLSQGLPSSYSLTREPARGKTRPPPLEHIQLPLGAPGQHPQAGKDSQPLPRGLKGLAAPRSHGWADLG